MSRVEDPTIKMELEELSERVRVLEQQQSSSREESSGKNAHKQTSSYRVVYEDNKHYIEFKAKEGWVRSSSGSFALR